MVRSARGERGLTLPEVLIALLVSMMVLCGVTAMSLSLIQGASLARGISEATALAQSRQEELIPLLGVSLSWPPSATVTEAGLSAAGGPSGPYTRSTTWALTSDGQRRLITVVVSWADALGVQHGVTIRRERSP